MVKDIFTELTDEQYENFAEDMHGLLMDNFASIVDLDWNHDGETMVVITIRSRLISAFESVLTHGHPLFQVQFFLDPHRSADIFMPPFSETMMEFPYPKKHQQMIWDIQSDFINKVDKSQQAITKMDLNEDGTLTDTSKANLISITTKQIEGMYALAEKLIRKHPVYLMAKSAKGLKIKGTQINAPQTDEERKVVELFEHKDWSYKIQAIDLAASLKMRGVIAYLFNNFSSVASMMTLSKVR